MRHIEIRELWLQKEVLEGKVKVVKVLGTENPADLMTKVLTKAEIEERLDRMGIDARWSVQTGLKETGAKGSNGLKKK